MKRTAAQLTFACLLSAGATMIFTHGLLRTGTLFTAVYFVVLTSALLLLGSWRLQFTIADLLAAGFALLCMVSLALHPTNDHRQLALLGLSLAAYPAARAMRGSVASRPLVSVLAAIVAAGTLATAYALVTQWSARHGKPLVFGQFDAAPAEFTTLLAVLMFALISLRTRLGVVAVLLCVPIAIFAASEVRFAFVALAVTLFAASVAVKFDRRRLRWATAVVVAFVAVGTFARIETTLVFVSYAADSIGLSKVGAAAAPRALPPDPARGCPRTNLDNSIEMRERLYTEAIKLLPSAGFFGTGLGSFAKQSCLKGVEVHDSFLQAAVELGIPTGLTLAALVLVVVFSLWPLATGSGEALFALCFLMFSALMSLAHGRVPEDAMLFLALGYGAACTRPIDKKPLRHLKQGWRCPPSGSSLEDYRDAYG